MAGTTPATKTLDRICAIAAAYTGIGAARTFKGYKRFGDTENFQRLIRALTAGTQAYFWARLLDIPSRGNLGGPKNFRFAAELYMKLDKDTSDDLNTAWDYAVGLRDALETESSYGNGEFSPHVGIGLAPVDTLEGMGILVFDFGSGIAGGSMVSIDP